MDRDTTLETVTIAEIGHKGDGVADTPTGRVFVPLSLPGEVLQVERDGERARIETIVAASPDRVTPVCVHFGKCGGCSLQHMAEPAYHAFKRQGIVDAFATRGLDVVVEPVTGVAPRSRRRAVIAVQRGPDGRVVAGFRERLSHRVAAAAGCHIVTPAIEAAMPKLVRVAEMLAFPAKGAIFTVLDTETGLDVTVSEATLPEKRRQDVITAALQLGFARFSVERETIVEARAPILRFGEVGVALPPGAFIQAVASAEETLAAAVSAGVGNAKRIADLFAGAGTFALRLARRAQVHAVESEARALDALSRAARHATGLKPISIEVRDLNRRPLMAKELDRFDAVVFDPPRDGAAPQAKELAKSKVPTIVAVSCNPATLARDAKYLVDAGWRIGPVKPVDQFLWSHHVEAVATFTRGG